MSADAPEHDYLWDPSVRPDPEVVAFERVLGVLAEPTPTRAPERVITSSRTTSRARGTRWLELTIALAAALVVLGSLWPRSAPERVPSSVTAPDPSRAEPPATERAEPEPDLPSVTPTPSRAGTASTDPFAGAKPSRDAAAPPTNPFAGTKSPAPKPGRMKDPFAGTKKPSRPKDVPPKDPFAGTKPARPKDAPPKDPFAGTKPARPKDAPPKDPFAN